MTWRALKDVIKPGTMIRVEVNGCDHDVMVVDPTPGWRLRFDVRSRFCVDSLGPHGMTPYIACALDYGICWSPMLVRTNEIVGILQDVRKDEARREWEEKRRARRLGALADELAARGVKVKAITIGKGSFRLSEEEAEKLLKRLEGK